MASQRFPGKMLESILGKSLIQRTYENTCLTKSLETVMVATDHKVIYDHVKGFGGQVQMSSAACVSGTQRVAEVAKGLQGAEIVVNIQGDEPCLSPKVIDALVSYLQAEPNAPMATAMVRLDDPKEADNPSVVKCVVDSSSRALYFSRSKIPYAAKGQSVSYHRHIGVYAFRAPFLQEFARLSATPLQISEDLEQLKILEHGYPIHVCLVEDDSIGVDTKEDLKKVEERLCKKNISLSPGALSHP